jgi:hypothetical protein
MSQYNMYNKLFVLKNVFNVKIYKNLLYLLLKIHIDEKLQNIFRGD